MSESDDPMESEAGQGFEEALAYLLVFSESLLDIVPDALVVLDADLRVRNANDAFAEAFAFGDRQVARGISLIDTPLFKSPIPTRPGKTLADALQELFQGAASHLEVARVDVEGEEGPEAWAVRASAWDTEDASFRRILAWFRPLPVASAAAPEEALEPSRMAPAEPLPAAEPTAPGEPTPTAPDDSRDALALARELLRRLPEAACVLDRAGRVLHENPRIAREAGAAAREEVPAGAPAPKPPGFADRFPGLGEAGIPALLEDSAREAAPIRRPARIILPDGSSLSIEIEVQPVRRADDDKEIQEFLLLLHEVLPMNPSTPTPDTTSALPETPEAILDGDRLGRWPVPATDRVLVVEADSWTRMAITDSLRDAGLADFAACESGTVVWARHDPSWFAVVLVGLDTSGREAADFCRRMTRDAPQVPVVALTEGAPERARELVSGLPLAGLLAGPVRDPGLARVATGLARRGRPAGAPAPMTPPPTPEVPLAAVTPPPTTSEPVAAETPPEPPPPPAATAPSSAARPSADFPVPPLFPEPTTSADRLWASMEAWGPDPSSAPSVPASPEASPPVTAGTSESHAAPEATPPPASGARYQVIVVGAQVLDLPGLRRLARSRDVHVRMVYDPNPSSPGAVLARELGLIATSDPAALTAGGTPDAIVVGEGGGGEVLLSPGLAHVPQVLRDEIDLFVADPESFLEAVDEPFAPDPPVPAPPRDEAPASVPPPFTPPAEAPADRAPVTAAPGVEASAELAPPAPSPIAPMLPVRDETPQPHATAPAAAAPPVEHAPPSPPAAVAPSAPPESAAPPTPRKSWSSSATWDAPKEFPPVPAGVSTSRWTEPDEPNAEHPHENLLDRDVTALAGAFDLLFDFERLCSSVLDSAVRTVHAASGSLMLIDEQGQYLRIMTAFGLSDLVVQETRQRVGQGIAGRVAEEGEPLLLVGTIGDERFPVRGERPEIPSAVCVPIVAEGRVLGVLNVNSDPHRDPFDHPELRRLADLGRRVGPALDRAWQLRVVRGRSFEMSVRAAIDSIAASGGDLFTRLRQVAARVVELLRVDDCAIWLYDAQNSLLQLRALAGTRASGWETLTLPVGSGLPGWVAQNRRALVLRNAPEDPADGDAARVAHVLTPIRHHTDLVGVLAIESTSGTVIDDKKLDLLRTIAAVLGEQISASQAQASSERMVTMLSALAELGVAFSAARERTNLGRLVAFTASTVLESDVATVLLQRENVAPGASGADLLERVAAHGASPGEGDPLTELEERVAQEVVARGGPVTETDLPPRQAESLMTRSNVASLLAVPMTMDKDLLGVVTVFRVADARGRDLHYGDQDREIASRLGDYAAAAAHRFSPHAQHDEGGEDES